MKRVRIQTRGRRERFRSHGCVPEVIGDSQLGHDMKASRQKMTVRDLQYPQRRRRLHASSVPPNPTSVNNSASWK